MKLLSVGLALTGILLPQDAARPNASPLVVHEWGTITTRHNPDGTPQGRLNQITQAEVLPAFVHRYEPEETRGNPSRTTTKTPLVPGRPDVTMRLETPVIYFYPPAGLETLPPFEVSVMFRGGVLNEFYPDAQASVAVDAERVATKMQAGLIKSWDGEVLNNFVVGSLRWSNVSLQQRVPLPETASPVWLAPRRVQSTGVTAGGEGERYLFYRGVGHLDALVQTRRSSSEIRLLAPKNLSWLDVPSMTVANLWLVDIRPDHTVAFRERGPLRIEKHGASHELGSVPLFADRDYARDGLGQLRAGMKRALIGAGLFDDEAEAMLETWKESYFGATGLRVFYIVPREWMDYFLPLDISAPHELTRVIVGRIDLKGL